VLGRASSHIVLIFGNELEVSMHEGKDPAKQVRPNLVAVNLIEHLVSSTLIGNSMMFEMPADRSLGRR